MLVQREELARAAGFFNGEGCTYCSILNRPSGGAHLNLTIGQSITELDESIPEDLIHFRRTFGFGHLNGPNPQGKDKPNFQYRLSGFEATQAVIAMMWPWLSWTKQLQYMTALDKWNHYQKLHPPRTGNYAKRRWMSS